MSLSAIEQRYLDTRMKLSLLLEAASRVPIVLHSDDEPFETCLGCGATDGNPCVDDCWVDDLGGAIESGSVMTGVAARLRELTRHVTNKPFAKRVEPVWPELLAVIEAAEADVSPTRRVLNALAALEAAVPRGQT